MTDNKLAGETPPTSPNAPAHGHAELSGRMGVAPLMLTVLAFSAPIAAVAGFIPFTIILGGEGATLVFVFATVLMLLFAVGYVTMTKSIPRPGSFYAFISAGLGKVVGLGGAFLALAAYLLILSGCYVFTGLFVTEFINSQGGPTTPWWVWAALSWALVSVLCYFHIEVSAKILTVAMALEVAIVMIFNLAVLARGGGPNGYSADPITPSTLSQGDVSLALLFAIMIFLGFEATALFRDEVRDPDRTIPRATYGAVLFVGTLYILSCYLLTTAYGDGAVQAATDSPKSMFADAIGQFAAPMFSDLTFVFIITSELAAAISVHNVTSRYTYNLGRDQALPAALAKVHPRHASPYRASVVVAAVVALVLVPLGLGNTTGIGLDAQLFGLGTVGVLVLMTLVSLSVIVWFGREPALAGAHWFKCFGAPGLAVVALGATVVFAVLNFELVVGGPPGQNLGLLVVLAAFLVGGSLLAVYFRQFKPEIFARLGRAEGSEVESVS
ncbi:APC family permease [Nocardioides luteus]|uniref:APC family permease n=1 Tax=Nocardioides luteus TaxID=1844 RepID=UPI0018C937E1|nr:APC family permease [Nocardioides luteus]MBG6095826.1 amino acid transporter [Nocardioides luteus]